MSFDRLAPHYRWMELVLAGNKLQRFRTAYLDTVATARNVLCLGEGNGRFLAELLRVNSVAEVVCMDASAKMLSEARRRAGKQNGVLRQVRFVQADILTERLPADTFDAVVTNFFLDCFAPAQLAGVVGNIAQSARPGAFWLLSDFQEAPGILRRARSRWILWSMYLFFRCVTALPARALTEPDELLLRNGFKLCQRQTGEWGLLKSDLWQKQREPKAG